MISAASFLALRVRNPTFELTPVNVRYDLVAAVLAPVWVAVLALTRTYEPRYLAAGSEEYRRVTSASLRFAGLLFAVSFLIQADLSRGFIGLALLFGTAFLALGRWLARQVLWRNRGRGKALHRVVVAGSTDEVAALGSELLRGRRSGMVVTAVCVPAADVAATAERLGDVRCGHCTTS
jgi:FlaA1/EpsC-like NDP-sugar epimerase